MSTFLGDLGKLIIPNGKHIDYGLNNSLIDTSSLQPSIFNAMELLKSLGVVNSYSETSTPLQDNAGMEPDLAIGVSNFSTSTTDSGVYGVTVAINIDTSDPQYEGLILYNDELLATSDERLKNWVILHELGHAIGLNHSFDQNGVALAALGNSKYDSVKYTMMAYKRHPDLPDSIHPTSLMLLDYLALQQRGLLGAYQTGSNIYHWDKDERVLHTIYDTGGSDTLSAAGHDTRAIIDLREGHFSSYGENGSVFSDMPKVENLAIAYGTIIENAIGGNEDDVLIGNAYNNNLQGGGGDDFLYGDGFYSDTDVDQWGFSSDHQTAYTATANQAGHNPGDNDTLNGDAGNDHLFGGAGSDTLSGGDNDDHLTGGADNDFLSGGAGSDIYRFNPGDGLDHITDATHAGDTILISADSGSSAIDLSTYTFKKLDGSAPGSGLYVGEHATAPRIIALYNGSSLTLDINGENPSASNTIVIDHFVSGNFKNVTVANFNRCGKVDQKRSRAA